MTTKSQEEVRRLLALDVREVSMVDQAANLRKFAIIKRMEEEMGALESQSQAGIEQNGAELATDLATVAAFVEKAKKVEKEEEMAKMVPPELKAAIARVMAFLGKVSSGSMPVDMKKAEHGNEEMAKAKKMEEEEKAKGKPEEEEMGKAKKMEEKEAEVKKSADPVEAPAIQVFPDGSVVVQGQPVHKAKGFTAGRTKTMTEVLRGIAGVLKEVDEESFKAVMEEVSCSSNKLPSGAKMDSAVHAVPTTKSANSDASLEMLQGIAARLEAIEKSRAPSKSVEGAGTTQEPVAKSKSFWSGVL